MALSANSRPHFTTIADFISSTDKAVIKLFLEVLLVCDHQQLIGREMFAIDGCKLPSNSSKEWSGTCAELRKKAEKMERAIERMVAQHQSHDRSQTDEEIEQKEKQYVEKLKKNVAKIREWLKDNNDRTGSSGKPIKSNITDNESAKMKTSKGVIQGYVGVTAFDSKHQVIVNAEAFGQGQEQDLLSPVITGIRENFNSIGEGTDVFSRAKLVADSGYHSESNMEMVFSEDIDAYVADRNFRQRDPRFATAERYKELERKRSGQPGKLFRPSDFTFADDFSFCLCPAGQRLYRSGRNVRLKGYKAIKFKGPKSACVPCSMRSRCLRSPDKTEIRQVAYLIGRTRTGKESYTERMKQKIDTTTGRMLYSLRLAIGEPPFAHMRSAMKLDRFTLRSKRKVNTQWNLFCITHNLKKIHRYGECLA